MSNKNKYDNLVEEINRKEEIADQKYNLAEQLSQVTKNVNDVKAIVDKLVAVIDDLKKIVLVVTAASKSTDNAVTAITNTILDSRNVVITNKLDDESVKQLQTKYERITKKRKSCIISTVLTLERCLNKTKTTAMRLSTEAMVSISEGKHSCGYTLSFASVLASFSWR